jgi:hypothetical protein
MILGARRRRQRPPRSAITTLVTLPAPACPFSVIAQDRAYARADAPQVPIVD